MSNTHLITIDGTALKNVQNFKYLGSWKLSSEKDYEARKALAWAACHKIKKIWKTNVNKALFRRDSIYR